MEQGIVTTFLRAPKVKGARPIAVLEVDEANVIKVTRYIKPKAFVLPTFSVIKWTATVKFTPPIKKSLTVLR